MIDDVQHTRDKIARSKEEQRPQATRIALLHFDKDNLDIQPLALQLSKKMSPRIVQNDLSEGTLYRQLSVDRGSKAAHPGDPIPSIMLLLEVLSNLLEPFTRKS